MNFKTQKEFNEALDTMIKTKRKRLSLRLTLRAFFERQCVSYIRKYDMRLNPKQSLWFKFCSKCEMKLRPARKNNV